MELTLEILNYSYAEHFKAEKDISLILPYNHPKRVKLRETINGLIDKIQKLNKKD